MTYNATDYTITVFAGDYLMLGIVAILSLIFVALFFLIALKFRHLVDRYRLKYGFDRELEKKEMKNPTEDKLNTREKYFRERVFKD